MSELDEVVNKIRELKNKLEKLINEKQDLIDPEVVSASKKLDEALVEYEKAIRKKHKGGINNKSNDIAGDPAAAVADDDSCVTGDTSTDVKNNVENNKKNNEKP
ncbi:MAG: aspartyl-phosphate phosphatase Spo0E family protein [Clostridiaceae bacterium]|nr:aspartyl-phosphate phosphatase Spo0E family protein [Clostridiaceae bacterium]